MKLKSLHPKNKFLPFLSLSILVIAGAVGIALLNQKQIFDEPEAKGAEVCLIKSGQGYEGYSEGEQICNENTIYTCSKILNRYLFIKSKKCPSGKVCSNSGDNKYSCTLDHSNDCQIQGQTKCNADWVQICTTEGVWVNSEYCPATKRGCWVGGDGNSAWCEAVPPRINRTPVPTPNNQPGWCSQDCTTRYECTSEDGKIISGRCATGEVCCDFR